MWGWGGLKVAFRIAEAMGSHPASLTIKTLKQCHCTVYSVYSVQLHFTVKDYGRVGSLHHEYRYSKLSRMMKK